MRLGTFKVKIVGLSPLLMHSSKGMKHRSEPKDPEESEAKKSQPPQSIEDEAEEGAYRLANGELYVPGSAVREALVTACKGYEIEVAGKKRKQPLWQVMAATVFLPQAEIPLYRNGKPIRDYDIDLRRVVVGRAGVVRARPTIALPWQLEAVIEYDAGQWASVGMIVEMLNNAGRYPGIIEYRPEKGGTFGRFEAQELKTAGKKATAKTAVRA